MSMTEAIKSVFSKYTTFSGRAQRAEYWYFTLFNFVISFILAVIGNTTGITIFSGLFSLAVLLPGLAVFWRRMHDIGKSGAWFLISFVPLVGVIILLVFLCTDSQPGDNQYGPNPKA